VNHGYPAPILLGGQYIVINLLSGPRMFYRLKN